MISGLQHLVSSNAFYVRFTPEDADGGGYTLCFAMYNYLSNTYLSLHEDEIDIVKFTKVLKLNLQLSNCFRAKSDKKFHMFILTFACSTKVLLCLF